MHPITKTKLLRLLAISAVWGVVFAFGMFMDGRSLIGIPHFSMEFGNTGSEEILQRKNWELPGSSGETTADAIAVKIATLLAPDCEVRPSPEGAGMAAIITCPAANGTTIADVDRILVTDGWQAGTTVTPSAMDAFRVYRRSGQTLFVGGEALQDATSFIVYLQQ